jgi:hypothetical protein
MTGLLPYFSQVTRSLLLAAPQPNTFGCSGPPQKKFTVPPS